MPNKKRRLLGPASVFQLAAQTRILSYSDLHSVYANSRAFMGVVLVE